MLTWIKKFLYGAANQSGVSGTESTREENPVVHSVVPLARVIRRVLEPIGIEMLESGIRKGMESIPPLPELSLQIINEINKPSSSARSVALLASRDPSLVAAILRTANSSAYSPSRPITAVEEAVAYLGLSPVRALIQRLGLSGLIKNGQSNPDFEELWTHSLVVSSLAESLADRFNADRGYCATLGLLHDLGKMVLLATQPELTSRLRERGSCEESRLGRERRLLGADHADVGAHLAAKWRLPQDLVDGIRFHHAPQLWPGAASPDGLKIARGIATVDLANQVAKYLHAYSDDTEIDLPSEETQRLMGIGPDPENWVDDRARRCVTDALLLAESSLGRPPGTTARLIRLADANQRKTVLDIAFNQQGPQRIDCQYNSSVLAFSAAEGEPSEITIKSGDDLLASCSRVESALDHFSAGQDLRRRIVLCLRWILESLKKSDPLTPVNLIISRRGGNLLVCLKCEAMKFEKRFGHHINSRLAGRALEVECAGVLNLRWFKEIKSSNDGSTLLMVA